MVIISEDTDVIFLCLAFDVAFDAEIYMKCGTKNRVRYIDIRKLANTIGKEVCQALVGLHAFTGCNTVSAFFGKVEGVGWCDGPV